MCIVTIEEVESSGSQKSDVVLVFGLIEFRRDILDDRSGINMMDVGYY